MKLKIPKEKLESLSQDSSSSIISFYNNIYKLKTLFRQGWLRKGIPENKCETVAEHSFAAALIAMMIVSKYKLELDLDKIIMMVLMHDLGEIFAGDITPEDSISGEEKYKAELNGLEKLFEGFSEKDKFINLWKEFEENKTPEARFVKQLDKIEMVLQANVYEKLEGVDLNEFFDSTAIVLNDDYFIEIFSELKLERRK